MKITSTLFALASLSLFACDTTESENIKTSGIYAAMEVVADGSGTARVGIELKVGGASSLEFLELTGGDSLSVARGTEVMGVTESMLLGITEYSATFSNAQANDIFVVDLDRPSDVSALGSMAQLPPSFDIVSPMPGDPASSRAGAMVINWDPTATGGGTMTIEVDGDCANVAEQEVDDSAGTFTFNPGDLDVAGQENASCQATVILRRKAAGQVSSAFGKGGVFLATQERRVDFQSEP